ncbi:MAG: hypothetical protein JSV52_13890 [Candidatus Zixiibacteriota bacterium]|nr:MAG: hypothetical protein JSV52_13890 [candidate division Zixibacteria bacterium]
MELSFRFDVVIMSRYKGPNMNIPNRSKLRVTVLTAVVFMLITACSSWAVNFEMEDNVHISNLHRIDDDLIAWGSNVTVDGLIEGDLITGGHTVNTNGHIRGSESVLAYKFHHTGHIDGSLRSFVYFLELDGSVGRSVLASGDDIRVGEKAIIGKDLILLGTTIHCDGLVKGSADLTGGDIVLSGTIHGDAAICGGKIKILAPAVIRGDLTYSARTKDALEVAPGVTILGETIFKAKDDNGGHAADSRWTAAIVQISKILAAFLFGVILLFLFNKYAVEAANQLRQRLAVATATGLLSMLIVVVSLLILIISGAFVLIGWIVASTDAAAGAIVLSLSILMVPITSFITVSGAVLFYSGKIIVAVVLGYFLIKLIKPGAVYLSRIQLLLGLIVLTIAFALPYLGFLIYLALSTIGAGAIVLGIKYCRRDMNQAAAPVPEPGEDS